MHGQIVLLWIGLFLRPSGKAGGVVSYQVGEAANPKDDDPTFAKLEDAEVEAKFQHGRDRHGLVPIAIWNEHCDIKKLYFLGYTFKPV